MLTELPLFMDFEASGLSPESYPIQVAWSAPDGSVTECWYIEPSTTYGWALEEAWADSAERVHGIPFATLLEQGKPAALIASRMNEQLQGQTVYVDGGAYDRVWCEQLFVAAGLDQWFAIGEYWDLILDILPPSQTRQSGWQYALQDAAWKRVQMSGGGRRHHADTDVRYLVELYRLALGRSVRAR
ncbi:MAG: hypothetical protein KKA36_03580 [Gammaproteobacteria bacterium]|nr:hypothetical protein [Gammaproteobacteria bacterium]MBU2478146.1 hypothetical protein [Gammaproteobacteria bacterium]